MPFVLMIIMMQYISSLDILKAASFILQREREKEREREHMVHVKLFHIILTSMLYKLKHRKYEYFQKDSVADPGFRESGFRCIKEILFADLNKPFRFHPWKTTNITIACTLHVCNDIRQ